MITQRKAASAVGGRTARACDSCVRKRARWYCVADDAFLCQGCDASVHSENQLASRHERVRLETASFKPKDEKDSLAPAWHQGFTRKARTPRHARGNARPAKEEEGKFEKPLPPMVPEMGSEEGVLFEENEEEQLLYRVPIFDPFAAELCDVPNDMEFVTNADGRTEQNAVASEEACDLDNIPLFRPSDMDIEELNVDTLLGTGFDEDSYGIEMLGLIDCQEGAEESIDFCLEGKRVKVEHEDSVDGGTIACHLDDAREGLDWNFDYESLSGNGEEEEEEKVAVVLAEEESKSLDHKREVQVRGKILLSLNYEGVITAWDNQGSPWTTGTRPEFNLDDCFPDFVGIFPTGTHNPYGGVGGLVGGSDGGREARVSRYREKRRTRLFSKKIRYEVRKLNAEKRPRMKGRFVKRTSFAGPVVP